MHCRQSIKSGIDSLIRIMSHYKSINHLLLLTKFYSSENIKKLQVNSEDISKIRIHATI